MIAFITCKSSLVPLLEGLCTSNPCKFEFSVFFSFCQNRILFVCVSLFRLGFEQLGLRLFSFTKKVYVNAYHTTPEWGICEDLETSHGDGMIGFEMVCKIVTSDCQGGIPCTL